MKRFITAALAAALLVLGLASPSQAAWQYFPHTWMDYNASNVASGGPDTAYTTAAASKVDTSSVFTYIGTSPCNITAAAMSTTGDTLIYGYVKIFCDSTTFGTWGSTGPTITLWGSAGVGQNWTQLSTWTGPTGTTYESFSIPILGIAANQRPAFGAEDAVNAGRSVLGDAGFRNLRVIVTWGAGAVTGRVGIGLLKHFGDD